MTASGPEDTGASWVGRQLLKSAHWTRESPLSAISVLRGKRRKILEVYVGFLLKMVHSELLMDVLQIHYVIISFTLLIDICL